MTMPAHSHLVPVHHSIFSGINAVDIREKMTDTCCCGCCTLSSATTVAVAICILESIYGLFWNIQMLLLFYSDESLGIFANFIDLTHFDNIDEHETVSPPNISPIHFQRQRFGAEKKLAIVHVLQSMAAMFKVLLIGASAANYVVNGLVLTSTGIHIFWMVFGIMVLRGNANLNRGLMTPWILFTYLLTAFDVASSIYFVVKFQDYFFVKPILYGHDGPTPALSCLILTLLFSRGLIMWFVNVYLAHVVDRRGKEIDQNNSLLAFYILSHLSHPPDSNMARGPMPIDPPPAYGHPNYFPKYVIPDSRSLDSSWSLTNEDARGVTAFSNPLFPRFSQASITDLEHNSSVNRRASTYGSPSVEQSFQTTDGVLPC